MAVSSTKTDEQLVMEKYPNAFVHDDGKRVYIMLRAFENVTCSECGRPYRREKNVDHMRTIGSGGTAGYAFADATKSLKLR